MNELDIPILRKSFDLYKTFHEYRKVIPKQDRFTIYERSEQSILNFVELLVEAGQIRNDRNTVLERASIRLNTLRFLIRLMKESKVIDPKKYVVLQENIDEIGKMLGGWIRSTSK